MKNQVPARMNMRQWAENTANQLRAEIKYHISQGVDAAAAVERVLEGSCIGKHYKSQIRYEFRGVSAKPASMIAHYANQ